MATITLRQLKGKPVLSLGEGETLGRVRGFLLDPAEARIVALVLDRRAPNKEPLIVATANLYQVGEAAITVEKRESVIPLSYIPRFQELARAQSPILGKMAITEDGTRLGRIRDLALEAPALRIDALLVGGFPGRLRRVPAGQVRTIGPDAVVIWLGSARETAKAPLPRPLEGGAPVGVPESTEGVASVEGAPAKEAEASPSPGIPEEAAWERWVEHMPGQGEEGS
jgi:uncharacterized protein YrrD